MTTRRDLERLLPAAAIVAAAARSQADQPADLRAVAARTVQAAEHLAELVAASDTLRPTRRAPRP